MSYTLVRGSCSVLGADPKGKHFLYVNGNSVFIRNIEDPFECELYTEHTHQVQVAKYSPSGFYIASADQTGKVKIWDTVNKEHLTKNEFQPLTGCIRDLQWSSDNQRIIVGGDGREKFGHVFNADTGTSVGDIMGSSKAINSVDLKPTRPFRAITGSEDSTVCFFEGPPFKWKKTLSEHERLVISVRYAPNGELFATGAADGKLLVYDGKTGDKAFELEASDASKKAHSGSIYGLCWDPTSRFILSVSGDKTARLWSVESRSLVKQFSFGSTVDDQQVACLWQNEQLITVSLSGHINYLNYDLSGDGRSPIIRVVKGHTKSITTFEIVAVSENEPPLVVSGSHDGLVIYWCSKTGRMNSIGSSQSASAHKNQIQSIRHARDTNTLISCALDDMVKFIDLNEKKYIKEIKLDQQPQSLDVSQTSDVVLVCCIDKIVLISKSKMEIVNSVPLNYEAVCLSISPVGNIVAIGAKDNKVHVYELNESAWTLTQVALIEERDFITAVRFSPDGLHLAVADNAKYVRCYRVEAKSTDQQGPVFTDITRGLWQNHAGKITNLAWTPDSAHLATSSVDTHCFIYSPSKISNFIQIKNAHPLNPLTWCGWLNNEQFITSSQDCCLRKWKLKF